MGEIFERTMPTTPLGWTGERLATATADKLKIEHLHRYFFARNLSRGLDVLDVTSGEGYGTALLAQVARSATGVEFSVEAVARANEAYSAPNLRFLTGDACRLPLDDASVDAVVSFETIEHSYDQELFLAEVRRVLRSNGQFIVSSPERDGDLLTKAQFEVWLRRAFAHVCLMAQYPMVGSAIVSERSGSWRSFTLDERGPRYYEASEGLPRVYIIAVASNHPITMIADSLYIATAEIEPFNKKLPALPWLLQSADCDLAAARDQLLAEARAAVASARSQRDLARIAARRAADAAEGAWHTRVCQLTQQVSALTQQVTERTQQASELTQQASELTQQASELTQQNSELTRQASELTQQNSELTRQASELAQQNSERTQRVSELEQQVVEWRGRYYGLRGRLEAILQRFWILPASRVIPAPMRRFVRDWLLGPARQ